MSEDTCGGCVHKPTENQINYGDICFECSRFYADKYTKIDEGEE